MSHGRSLVLPVILMGIFALSRWPGLMPPNFSAAYALAFCAGVYFRQPRAWSWPLGVLLLSDILINVLFYHTDALNPYMAVNYAAYFALNRLGRQFRPRLAWVTLVCGGVLGALLFHLITNSFAWLQNPAYLKTLGGWIQALTLGSPGWPHTWEFFRNTLMSGGLFTALFAGAVKLAEPMEADAVEEADGRGAPANEEAPAEEAPSKS